MESVPVKDLHPRKALPWEDDGPAPQTRSKNDRMKKSNRKKEGKPKEKGELKGKGKGNVKGKDKLKGKAGGKDRGQVRDKSKGSGKVAGKEKTGFEKLAKRIEQLSAKNETLDSGVAELRAELAEREAQSVEAAIHTISVEKTIATVARKTDALETKTTAIRAATDALEILTRGLSSRVADLVASRQQADDEQQLAALHERIARVERQAEEARAQTAALREEATAADGRIGELAQASAQVQATTDAIDGRVAELTGTVAPLVEDVRRLDSEHTNAGQHLQALGERVSQIGDRADEVETHAAALRDELRSTGKRVGELELASAEARSGTAAVGARVTELSGVVEPLAEEVRRVDADRLALESRVSSAASVTAHLRGRAEVLDTRVDGFDARADELESNLERIQERVGSLEQATQMPGRAELDATVFDEVAIRSDDLEQAQTELLRRVDGLDDTAGKVVARIDAVEVITDQLATERQGRDEGMGVLQGQVERLEDRVGALAPMAEAAESAVSENRHRLDGIETASKGQRSAAKAGLFASGAVFVALVATAVGLHLHQGARMDAVVQEVTPKIEALATRVDAREPGEADDVWRAMAASRQRVKALEQNLKKHGQRLTEAEGGTSALGEKLATTDTETARLARETERLRSAVDELEAQLAASHQELKKQVSRTAPAEGRTHTEDWLLLQPPDYFAIQLVGMRDKAGLLSFIGRHQLTSDTAYYRAEHQGQDWFVVLSGVYPDRNAARQAIASLPAALRRHGPWVRRLDEVQEQILSRSR